MRKLRTSLKNKKLPWQLKPQFLTFLKDHNVCGIRFYKAGAVKEISLFEVEKTNSPPIAGFITPPSRVVEQVEATIARLPDPLEPPALVELRKRLREATTSAECTVLEKQINSLEDENRLYWSSD